MPASNPVEHARPRSQARVAGESSPSRSGSRAPGRSRRDSAQDIGAVPCRRPPDGEQPERKSRLLGSGDIDVSFEFFPPKTEKMEETLWSAITRLAPLRPDFVSVTYGAGGSTRERTHATVARLVRETALEAGRASHLRRRRPRPRSTTSRAPTGTPAFATSWRCAAIPPHGAGAKYEPASRRLRQCGRSRRRPEEHRATSRSRSPAIPRSIPKAPSLAADIDNLKAKVDAGADRIITQFGFDNAHFLRFLERARARRHLGADRARHRADPQLQAGGELCRSARRHRAVVAGPALRRARRRPRDDAIWSPPPSRPSRSWTSSTRASRNSTSTR